MVKAIVTTHVIQTAHGAAFRVGRPEDAAIDARVNHEARTHKARLERHVDGATRKAPPPKGARCLEKSRKLRMGRRVFIDFASIVRTGDHASLIDHHSPNGNLARLSSKRGFAKRHTHKTLVFMSLCHYEPFAEILVIRCYH